MENAPEVDVGALEHVTEVSISAGRKKQLDQYEPINEQATFTLEFPDGMTIEEKKTAIENAEQAAWAQTERGIVRRYEEYVRDDVMGDD